MFSDDTQEDQEPMHKMFHGRESDTGPRSEIDYLEECGSCNKLSAERTEAKAALQALRDCIMDTRGPDARKAMERADAVLKGEP